MSGENVNDGGGVDNPNHNDNQVKFNNKKKFNYVDKKFIKNTLLHRLACHKMQEA